MTQAILTASRKKKKYSGMCFAMLCFHLNNLSQVPNSLVRKGSTWNTCEYSSRP